MSSEIDVAMSRELDQALERRDLPEAARLAADIRTSKLVTWLSRQPIAQQAVLFRLLAKDRALRVFEAMNPTAQADLVGELADHEVTSVFDELDPDDRASLLDELPAKVARRLLHNLDPAERDLTAVVLGYPERSVGRRMSPEVIALPADSLVGESMQRVRERMREAETVYTLPVIAGGRRVVGVVSLRDLLGADPTEIVGDLARRADLAFATEDVEAVARRTANLKRLALPVVDSEERLVGIFTVDDALTVLEDAAEEDQARQGGSEPLRSPYLATPLWRIVRSRVVWLLVLAVGATLTVQVLEQFESTLGQMVVLSVFIPLLIGTGGNTGNQAATTVTRALAVGDVEPRDVLRIVAREFAIGLSLGAVLGGIAFALISLVYGVEIGEVIGLTLLVVCTLAAVAGGVIPLVARTLRADPAVFSNPFISTLLDASGLVIYFLIARTLLGL
ncbi:magnesium transporter [Enemella sp. A6]|uniref:magnesium transporter n=1 Tax=Enemella sp. A6 TaxID=3440152 RepID=UPI003EBA9987